MGVLRILRYQTVGGLANWSGLLTQFVSLSALGAALTWAASAWDTIYEHGWGAAVFAGLAALCVLLFFLSIAAVAWRIYRPLPPQMPMVANETADPPSADNAELVNSKLLDLEETVRKLTDFHIDALSKNGFAHDRILEKQNSMRAELNDVIALLAPEPTPMGLLARLGMPERAPAKDRFESINSKIEELRDQTNGRSDGLNRAVADLKNKLENVSSSISDVSNYTKGMFRAQRISEIYGKNLTQLDEMSDRLNDPASKPEVFSDWRIWNEVFDAYKSKLRHTCGLISPYISIEETVFETPNEKFKSQYWQYDFKNMTDDQKHDYKTYRIIRSNFEERKEDIGLALNTELYSKL